MFTWIDFLIIVIILLYAYGGYRQGFLRLIVDLLGLVISFVVALKYYNFAGTIFTSWGLNPNLAKPIGFFALWTIVQITFWLLTILIFHYLPGLVQENKVNRYLGTLPGALKGLIIVAVFLIIIMILPFSASVKGLLSSSKVAGGLIKATAKVENQMETIFGQLNNTLTFTGTIQENDGTTALNFHTDKFEINQDAELKLVGLVNEERAKFGVKPLVVDLLIRNVARAHSMDMIQKGYFAHDDPSGLTPYDRLMNAHVTFRMVGENLALAPTIELAHIGLMNSPSHRENILDPDYGRIGIGVMDAGIYGLMITQDFAN